MYNSKYLIKFNLELFTMNFDNEKRLIGINKEIELLENKNRFLTNEISQLNNGNQTKEDQKRIDGNFEEIKINELLINQLKRNI